MNNIDEEYFKFKNSRFYDYFDMLINEVEDLRKKNVSFYFFQTPLQQNIQWLSKAQRKRLSEWKFDFTCITENDCKIISQIYPADITTDYLEQVYDGVRVYKKNGIRYLADFQSKYVNIVMGKRVTLEQPEQYRNKIYIYGQCTARGTGVEDRHTIPSFLQKKINVEYPDLYQVVNMAIGCGSDLYDDIMHMEETHFRSGDIVVLCTNLEIVPVELFHKNQIIYYDTSAIFSDIHDYGEWFTDSTFHTTAIGNNAIADYIYHILEVDEFHQGKREDDRTAQDGTESEVGKDERRTDGAKDGSVLPEELKRYLEEISHYREEGRNGCIVMNCNPFTYGHQFLVEYAAECVDHLFVFVVEEDKSFFPFADRMQLVKKGTVHLKNVKILPSGKYIISALTFPGYFMKDGNKEITVDVSLDVDIFAKFIAPALDIQVRFAGEEPNDYVTRKYNEEMKDKLPLYGIEFVVIPRKRVGDCMISASRVRELIKDKHFDEIEKFVPETTLKYLMEKYG